VNYTSEKGSKIFIAITHVPLLIIAIGFVGNTITFLVFRLSGKFKRNSSMVYLSFVSLTDTLSLFGWNLDHFLRHNTNFVLETTNLATCRLYTFNQYFSLQSSALLLSMLCIDRFMCVVHYPVSFLSSLPFRTTKTAFAWSFLIMSCVSFINSYILISAGLYVNATTHDPSSNVSTYKVELSCYMYASGFQFFPIWERVHMVIYNLIPFVIMVVFNTLLIKNLLVTFKPPAAISTKTLRNYRKKVIITVSLICVTFLFLLTTLPTSVMFGFFFQEITKHYGLTIVYFSDSIMFLNHASLFFICFISNLNFRRTVFCFIKKSKSYLIAIIIK
jgi:hypothetical protein